MTNKENPIHRIKSYLGSGSGSKSKWYGSETLDLISADFIARSIIPKIILSSKTTFEPF